jgi:hypothetical protein
MRADRYARHALIDGFSQQALAAMRLAVVGAGAIGNEVVKNLALLGVGMIDVIDFDRVEVHNLTRSVLLRESDVGTSKALAVARRAAELDPSIRVRGIDADLTTALGPADVARYDGLICAVDNFEARIRASQLCRIAGRTLVNAAIDHRHASVERYPFGASRACACFECHLPDSAYQRIAQRYACGGLRRALMVERKVPTTTITASLAGAQAVSLALFADDGGAGRGNGRSDARDEPVVATRLFIDSRRGLATTTRLARHDGCIGCSGQPDAIRVVARAGGLAQTLARLGVADDEPVLLSDALIVERRCAACGAVDRARVGERAADHDDTLMHCDRCGRQAMRIDIRDRFEARELQALGVGESGGDDRGRERGSACQGDGGPLFAHGLRGPRWASVPSHGLVVDLGAASAGPGD